MLALIGKLYQIERQIKDMSPEQKHSIRQQQAKPILDKIRQWLDKQIPRVTPKSDLGKAIRYTHNLWDKLTLYVTDYGNSGSLYPGLIWVKRSAIPIICGINSRSMSPIMGIADRFTQV